MDVLKKIERKNILLFTTEKSVVLTHTAKHASTHLHLKKTLFSRDKQNGFCARHTFLASTENLRISAFIQREKLAQPYFFANEMQRAC